MLTSDLAAGMDSKQIHSEYLADSDAYRLMCRARQSQHRARQSQRYGLVERLGARLIALGRALCERRGTLAVEIAFRAGTGTKATGDPGRNVA